MVSSDRKLANVVGGKTARACVNCVRKRARWYCAADDAFLCQSCDGAVHSANPLARRHERVRLKVASLKLSSLNKRFSSNSPLWQHGFTKKPRTPRGGKTQKHGARRSKKFEEGGVGFVLNPLHLVPEIGGDEGMIPATTTSDEQLLYQVPVFDPFAAELCLSGSLNEPAKPSESVTPAGNFDLNSLNGLLQLPSDVELAEFAADVESLLGKGLDDESFAMDGLGLLDCSREKEIVKVELQDHDHGYDHEIKQCEMVESDLEMMREPFQLSFDYDSPLWEEEKAAVHGGGGGYEQGVSVVKEDEDDVNIVEMYDYENNDDNKKKKKNKRILKLDYEGIIAAWDEERSPWTTGGRPELDPDDCWPDCMGGCGIDHHHHHHHHHPYGDHMGPITGNPAMLDGGREARVSRYREKRRTRLFSKKIRYEVRKLNAEKRPRMKGRFVKRASCSGFPMLSK